MTLVRVRDLARVCAGVLLSFLSGCMNDFAALERREGSSHDDAGADDAGSEGTITITRKGVQTFAVTGGSTTNVVLAAVAGVVEGDVLLACLAVGDSAAGTPPSIEGPSGFRLQRRIDHGAATALLVYTAAAGPSEPTSYTWRSDHPIGGVGFLSAYSGVDASDPIEAQSEMDFPSAGTSFAVSSLDTTTSGTLLVAAFFGKVAASGIAPSWHLPEGMTDRSQITNGGSRSGALGDEPRAAVGATGVRTATVATPIDYAMAAMVALRPRPR